jgi:hypothetical protein
MAKRTALNWAPVAGRWSFKESQVTYTGPDPGSRVPFGVCLSDRSMMDGSVSCCVRFTDTTDSEGRILMGYRSLDAKYLIAGLGGWKRAYTIGEHVPGFGWRGLEFAGSADNFVPNDWYSQRVNLEGQRVQVSANKVRVLQHVLEKPIGSGQVGLFAFGTSPVEFDDFVTRSYQGKAFVVMKFEPPYERLYREVIQPVARQFRLGAKHVGEVFGPGIILKDIVRGIVEAEVVIVEITPVHRNENVFYELGYSHALNKPTILLAKHGRRLPFDVSGYRVLFYDDSAKGKKQLRVGLEKHLKAIREE